MAPPNRLVTELMLLFGFAGCPLGVASPVVTEVKASTVPGGRAVFKSAFIRRQRVAWALLGHRGPVANPGIL